MSSSTTMAAVGGAGSVVSALLSPWPLLVLAGLVLVVLAVLAVVVLTAALSRDDARCRRATAVLDRLLTLVPHRTGILPVASAQDGDAGA